MGRRPLQAEEQIRAARLKPGEIDGDVQVPELAEARDDGFPPPVLPQTRHLLERDLETGEAIVVADAELAEAERADVLFRGVDLTQLVRGDPVPVLKARRQTRERGLVPGRQT